MRGRLTAIRASCGARQFEGCDRGSVARLWSSERDGLLLLLLLLVVLPQLGFLIGISLLASLVAIVKRIFIVHISVHQTHSQRAHA